MSIKIIKKSNKEPKKLKKKEIHSENSKSTMTKGLTKKLPRKFIQRANLKGQEKGFLINLWLNAKYYTDGLDDLGDYGIVKIDYSTLANYLGYRGVKQSRNKLQVKKVLDSLVNKESFIQYEETPYGKYDLKITILINDIDKNFVQVPYLFNSLSPEYISIMVVLLSFMDGYNPSEPVYPSVDTICEYSGIGYRNKVVQILQTLKEAKFIQYQEQEKGGGRNKTNKYYLADETGRMYYVEHLKEEQSMDQVISKSL